MVDEDMEDSALAKVAEQEQGDVAATWQAIKADLRAAGPFAKMILSFRASATEALVDLAYIETADPAVIKLQAEVRRYVTTIGIIHGYREGARAVDANAEAVSDEDQGFLTTLEDEDL